MKIPCRQPFDRGRVFFFRTELSGGNFLICRFRYSIAEIIDQWDKLKELDEYRPLYDRFKKYFGYMNTGFRGKKHDIFAYNGGLFKPDEVLDGVTISDGVFATTRPAPILFPVAAYCILPAQAAAGIIPAAPSAVWTLRSCASPQTCPHPISCTKSYDR